MNSRNDWTGVVIGSQRYRIGERLGGGGMADVWLAEDRNLQTTVVVKIPRPVAGAGPQFAARFVREVRSLVNLAHPNIVKIIDVVEHDGNPIAVMQYLAGGSLADLGLQRSLAEVGQWLPPVAAALDFVHAQGYVHRDVKPANILFDTHGHVYLSDFGVVKALSEEMSPGETAAQTMTGMILGTPAFMPPEMIMGGVVDGRADQYSLAATVYEMFTGKRLFENVAPGALLVMAATADPPTLSESATHLPQATSDVLAKALSKQPEDRFDSCAEFVAAMLQGRPNVPPPLPPSGVQLRKAETLFRKESDDTAQSPVRSKKPLSPSVIGKQSAPQEAPKPAPMTYSGASVQREASSPQVEPAKDDESLCADRFVDSFADEESSVELDNPSPNHKAFKLRTPLVGAAGALLIGAIAWLAFLGFNGGEPATVGNTPLGEPSTSPDTTDVAGANAADPSPAATEPTSPSGDAPPSPVAAPPEPAARPQEPASDDSALPKMVRIEADEFRMGTSFSEKGRDSDETAHQVKFTRPFLIAAYETTQAEYEAQMSYNPAYFSSTGGGKRYVARLDHSRYPVENVSFYDAIAYCNRLSRQAKLSEYYELSGISVAVRSIVEAKIRTIGGDGFRLPTEAEWEYACRAHVTAATSFGDHLTSHQANFDGEYPYGTSTKGPYLRHTAAVGSYEANAFGLFDMHGNVGEWCYDHYDSDFYTESILINPRGPIAGDFRVNRGGSWYSPGAALRSGKRKGNLPGSPSHMTGFRVARTILE